MYFLMTLGTDLGGETQALKTKWMGRIRPTLAGGEGVVTPVSSGEVPRCFPLQMLSDQTHYSLSPCLSLA